MTSTQPSPVRRVVTGHDATGRAVFVSDESVGPTATPAFAVHLLWGADTTPVFPDAGAMPDTTEYFPPVGGFRFVIVRLPPDTEVPADLDDDAVAAEVEEKFPGMMHFHEDAQSGMHTTATIDFEVILSGTCVLELDDGATVHLHPGDTVVQNGTRHRWSNPGPEPCFFVVFLAGAVLKC